jgi:hypothetical protein
VNWIDRIAAGFTAAFGRPDGGRRSGHAGPAAAPPGHGVPAEWPDAAAPGEVAWADGLHFGTVPLERWNPDALVGRQGYDVFRRMLHDDQVRALVALKQAAVVSRGWRFQLVRDDPPQRRCADFFRFLLDSRLAGSFQQALGHVLTSQVHGFSLVEKVYAPVRWRGRERWGVVALKLRPPESFTFQVDAHGNRTGLVQQQGPRRVALAPERFIHHVNKPHAHPQYGESDLRECHRHWWAKEAILQFWNVYLERMAAGFVHGRIVGKLSAAEREELKRVMESLNTRSSVITPGAVELSVVSAPSTDAFERAVAARDKAMAKALLVPNLLGLSEQGAVGSHSQSRTQLETFFFVLGAIAESLADVLNEQLFRELARWNFGLDDPPRFAFEPLSVAQRREFARAWQEALRGGSVTQTPQDEATVRELLGFPLRAEPSAAGAG